MSRLLEKLHYVEVNATATTDLRQRQMTWPQYVAKLSMVKERADRDDVFLIGGQHYKPHAEAKKTNNHYSRCNDNVLGVDIMFVDVDNGGCDRSNMKMTLEDGLELFKEYEYVCYTSFNHRNPAKDNGVDKFRFVLPLASYCPADEWQKRRDTLIAMYPFADGASFVLSQPFYPAIVHPSRTDTYFFAHNTGKWYDWQDVPAVERPAYDPSSYILSDRVLDKQEMIRTTSKYGTISSDLLFNLLRDGEKVPCFTPFREEHNASAFVARRDNGLFIFDMGSRQGKFIPVVEAIKLPKNDGLTLVKKAKTDNQEPHENITLDNVAPKKKLGRPFKRDQKPAIEFSEEKVFHDPLSQKARQQKLKDFNTSIADTNLIFAPEGFGKSYLIVDLIKRGKKVLFGCQSNEQAELKAAEFPKWFEQPEHKKHLLKPPVVQHVWSKDHHFYKQMGFRVVRKTATDPFEEGDIDKLKTIEKIVENYQKAGSPRATVKDAAADFKEHHEDVIVPEMSFNRHDIIVTTFARVQLLVTTGSYRSMSDEWVIVLDDPGVADLSMLKKYDEHFIIQHHKTNTNRRAKGKAELPDLETIKIDDYQYFVRPIKKALGMGFDTFTTEEGKQITPKIVFTTTEEQTKHLLECNHKGIKVTDLMTNIDAGKITLLGTQYVWAKFDGLISPLVSYAASMVTDGKEVHLIGDGLGQKLNHVTNKGQNDLKEAHMVVELSRPHPAANIKLMHELQWASNFSSDWNPTTVAGIMMYDQMNQAIGRNAGYRHIGSETIVLCDPTFFGALRAASRYKLTPYSALLSQDTNAYRQKQNTKIIEDNLQIISPLARTLIDGLLEPYSFVSSEGFRFGIQCLKNEVEVKRLMVALTSLREVAESAKAARTDPRISFLGQFETLEGELLARLSHVVSA